MRRKFVVEISLILTCLSLILVLKVMPLDSDTDHNLSEQRGDNSVSDKTNIVKLGIKIQNNKSIEDSKDLISQYLSNLEYEGSKLFSRDCVTWEESNTPNHKFTLFRRKNGTVKIEESDNTSNEEKEQRKKSFEKIFDTNAWGKSKSGPGSLISATDRIRKVLNSVIDKLKQHLKKEKISFLDSSCGDMAWMPEFLANRSDIIFTGFDIVQSNIDNHRQRFADQPQWQFRQHDIVSEEVSSSYDLVLSRHTTQHLQTDDVVKVVTNFINSKSRFLITTNYPKTKVNAHLSTNTQYRHRPLNLYKSPFYFPPPICYSQDVKEDFIMLWDLSTLSLHPP